MAPPARPAHFSSGSWTLCGGSTMAKRLAGVVLAVALCYGSQRGKQSSRQGAGLRWACVAFVSTCKHRRGRASQGQARERGECQLPPLLTRPVRANSHLSSDLHSPVGSQAETAVPSCICLVLCSRLGPLGTAARFLRTGRRVLWGPPLPLPKFSDHRSWRAPPGLHGPDRKSTV